MRRGRRTIAVAVPAVIFLAKSLGAVAACYYWVIVLINETGLQNMWNGEVIGSNISYFGNRNSYGLVGGCLLTGSCTVTLDLSAAASVAGNIDLQSFRPTWAKMHGSSRWRMSIHYPTRVDMVTQLIPRLELLCLPRHGAGRWSPVTRGYN